LVLRCGLIEVVPANLCTRDPPAHRYVWYAGGRGARSVARGVGPGRVALGVRVQAQGLGSVERGGRLGGVREAADRLRQEQGPVWLWTQDVAPARRAVASIRAGSRIAGCSSLRPVSVRPEFLRPPGEAGLRYGLWVDLLQESVGAEVQEFVILGSGGRAAGGLHRTQSGRLPVPGTRDGGLGHRRAARRYRCHLSAMSLAVFDVCASGFSVRICAPVAFVDPPPDRLLSGARAASRARSKTYKAGWLYSRYAGFIGVSADSIGRRSRYGGVARRLAVSFCASLRLI